MFILDSFAKNLENFLFWSLLMQSQAESQNKIAF